MNLFAWVELVWFSWHSALLRDIFRSGLSYMTTNYPLLDTLVDCSMSAEDVKYVINATAAFAVPGSGGWSIDSLKLCNILIADADGRGFISRNVQLYHRFRKITGDYWFVVVLYRKLLRGFETDSWGVWAERRTPLDMLLYTCLVLHRLHLRQVIKRHYWTSEWTQKEFA